ncbi:hypothetical protein [Colwellia sp. E150_009]|jgi:hypothetical protein
MILRQEISSNATELGVTARFFKVLRLAESATAEFRGSGWNLRTSIKSGLSIDLSVYGTPCEQIVFESVNTQDIEFWAGIASVDDSSLSGAVGVDSANRVIQNDVKNINSITEIYPENITRQSGTFHISAPCYVNDAVNGIILAAGLHQWTNKQSMSLIPVSGSVDVRSMDELF